METEINQIIEERQEVIEKPKKAKKKDDPEYHKKYNREYYSSHKHVYVTKYNEEAKERTYYCDCCHKSGKKKHEARHLRTPSHKRRALLLAVQV